mgnify:CR=1 FL=1
MIPGTAESKATTFSGNGVIRAIVNTAAKTVVLTCRGPVIPIRVPNAVGTNGEAETKMMPDKFSITETGGAAGV